MILAIVPLLKQWRRGDGNRDGYWEGGRVGKIE